jgi:DNA-3-methyladenine glycosylase
LSAILRIQRLRRRQLPVDAVELARYLLGKTLVHDHPHGRVAGRIVETEAYPPGDAAGHAFRGRTRSNNSLFLERGRAYVYFTYGSCFMMNVSAEAEEVGAGVLIRALEPLEGVELMQRFSSARLADITRGPGRLARAMNIDKRFDGVDLCAPGALWLGSAVRPRGEVGAAVRIGITREVHRKLRFFERGNRNVSGPRRISR